MTTPEPPARLTYTVRETSQALGLPEWTIYQYCRSKALPSVRVGRRILVPIAALDTFLADIATSNEPGQT